jgi:NTE family protein
VDELTAILGFDPDSASRELEQHLAERLAVWSKNFANIIVNPVSAQASARCEALARLATHQGELLGPGDSPMVHPGSKCFVVSAAPHAGLPYLSGEQQRIGEAAESERDYHAGRTVRAKFRRTVDSLARFVADLQVGLALGGGAAWGLAHVGVVAVLERAGFPLDVVAGCSMGSIIGAMVATGMDAAEMNRTAAELTRHPSRFVEFCFWRMHLISERVVRRVLEDHLGKTALNETVIPFWVNALNIQNGEEWTLRQGSLTDAVRASIALPGLLPPVTMGGGLLVDAGIINPVPVRQIRQMNCRYAIAVNAMQSLDAQPINRRYPFNMLEVFLRCFRISGHEMGAARCEAAADLMLTPRLGNISMLQFHRSAELIQAGEQIAEECLPAIRAGYDQLKPRPAARRPCG